MLETKPIREKYANPVDIKVYSHDTEVLTVRARCAIELITKWGMVQAKDDGEDSAGRHKLGLMSEEEVVDRACNMTDKLFNKMDEVGWIHHLPTLEEMKAIIDREDEKILEHNED